MLVELVETTTPDGLLLHGALYRPDASTLRHEALDAVLLLHGTGSNFYASSLWKALVPSLCQWGLTVLAANTRGHDVISTARSADGRRLFGAAYEMVDECRHDIVGWLEFLVGRGQQRIGLVGHSLGAVKAVYSQAVEPHAAVRCIAALSPPRLSHAQFAASPYGPAFLKEYEQAAAQVAAGRRQVLLDVRFPLPYVVTAAGYIDKYGSDERYNVLKYIDRVTCPMLFTYGTAELLGMAFAEMPEALGELATRGANLRVVVMAGADHLYTGLRTELAARLESWLRRLS